MPASGWIRQGAHGPDGSKGNSIARGLTNCTALERVAHTSPKMIVGLIQRSTRKGELWHDILA